MTARKYWVIGNSITGASHSRKNKPNQDAIIFDSHELENGSFAYGIVSDGHGSSRCFRSHLGSGFASEILEDAFIEMARNISDDTNRQELKNHAEMDLPKLIVNAWRLRVDDHVELYPYSDEELKLLVGDKKKTDNNSLKEKKYTPYGATLLGVLMLAELVLYVQLGDGDILITDEAGEVYRRFVDDQRLLGNETTSLCQDEAINEFQIAIDFLVDSPPRLILICTDGFSNAYKLDSELFMFPRDIVSLYKNRGTDIIQKSLPEWLEETTVKASGDDISVCLIFPEELAQTESQVTPEISEAIIPDEHEEPETSGKTDEGNSSKEKDETEDGNQPESTSEVQKSWPARISGYIIHSIKTWQIFKKQ